MNASVLSFFLLSPSLPCSLHCYRYFCVSPSLRYYSEFWSHYRGFIAISAVFTAAPSPHRFLLGTYRNWPIYTDGKDQRCLVKCESVLCCPSETLTDTIIIHDFYETHPALAAQRLTISALYKFACMYVYMYVLCTVTPSADDC